MRAKVSQGPSCPGLEHSTTAMLRTPLNNRLLAAAMPFMPAPTIRTSRTGWPSASSMLAGQFAAGTPSISRSRATARSCRASPSKSGWSGLSNCRVLPSTVRMKFRTLCHLQTGFSTRASRRPALSATIDAQHLTGDERAERACKDFHHARDFVDGGDAVQCAGLDHAVLIDRARAHEAAGAGVARRDAVDGDVIGAKLVGEAARVVRHAGFRHRIDRTVGAALEGGDRADGDDAALTPRHHFLCYRLAGQNGGEQIAVEHRADVFLANAYGVIRIGLAAPGGDVASGIVDEDVDWPQFLYRGFDDARDLTAVGEIAQHADGADAMRCGNVRGDRRQRRSFAVLGWAILAHAVNGDIGSEAREPLGERAAKPASRAGNQRNLALERSRGFMWCHDLFSLFFL